MCSNMARSSEVRSAVGSGSSAMSLVVLPLGLPLAPGADRSRVALVDPQVHEVGTLGLERATHRSRNLVGVFDRLTVGAHRTGEADPVDPGDLDQPLGPGAERVRPVPDVAVGL